MVALQHLAGCSDGITYVLGDLRRGGGVEGAVVQVARRTEPISRQVARQEYAAGALCLARLGSSRCGSTEPCVIVEIDGNGGGSGGTFRQRIWGGKHPDKMG